MVSHVIVFNSAEKHVGLTAPCDPHQEQIGDWRVFETLQPHPHEDLREKGIGVYRLVLERVVSTQDEVWTALHEACKLADELDVAWCYASGKPYYATEFRRVSSEAPRNWSGNLRDVERDIQRETSGAFVAASAFVDLRWAWWPSLPLQRTLTARQACTNAPPVIRELIELHVRSHKAHDAELFLLAKALEIVGAYFRGSRASRNASIEQTMKQIGVHATLTQTVEWLFDIANERFDVRHAWDKDSPGVALHPRMTDRERTDFINNADLVIRAFICERLGIPLPLITVNHGEPTKPGQWKGDVLDFGA